MLGWAVDICWNRVGWVKEVPNFPVASGCLQIILCGNGESSQRHICFCHRPDTAGFPHVQLLLEIMSMPGCKIGPIMTISWQREKTETIFKWKLWIRWVLQSAAKNCVKTLKSWTRQFSHASGFLLFMVLRLCFWRTGMNIFQWDVFILRSAHYHSSSIIFCESQAGERWCALMFSQGWNFAKKTCSSALHTVIMVLP